MQSRLRLVTGFFETPLFTWAVRNGIGTRHGNQRMEKGPPIGVPAPFGLVVAKAGLCTRTTVLSEETQLIYGRAAGNADLRWPRVT